MIIKVNLYNIINYQLIIKLKMGSSTSRRYFWIDAQVFNNENSNIYNECFREKKRKI